MTYTAESTSRGAVLILKDGAIDIELTSSVDYLSQGQQLCNELNGAIEMNNDGITFEDLEQCNTHVDLSDIYATKPETPHQTAQIERWLPIMDHISKHKDNRKKLREIQLLGGLSG